MAKNRKQIEDEILRNEVLGDEEDYGSGLTIRKRERNRIRSWDL